MKLKKSKKRCLTTKDFIHVYKKHILFQAGMTGQQPHSIAIGSGAGSNSQDDWSFAIGYQAGMMTNQVLQHQATIFYTNV